MKHSLDNIVADSGLGLVHRVRGAVAGIQDKAPCLILLHGVGASEIGFIELARQQDPRLAVILVRGPITFGPIQFGWFQVNFTAAGPVINPAQAEQSRQALIAFIAGLPAAYNIDPQRIWIAGFSQGGIMSASVGLTAPANIAGFGIFSGRIPPEIAPLITGTATLSKRHAFVSHGVDDSKLPVDFARNAQSLLNGHKLILTYHEYDAGHEFNPTMQRDFSRWIAPQLDAANAGHD